MAKEGIVGKGKECRRDGRKRKKEGKVKVENGMY